MKQLVQAVSFALVLLISAPAWSIDDSIPLKTSFSTDVSDLWWNPNESGWGIQMVETGTFVFVTIYVYGLDGKPTWFGGGLNPAAANTFNGTLYAVTGPYFGGPFNPAGVATRVVGTIQFQLTGVDAGIVTYSVDGVAVTKPVQRQPLTLDNYSGTYATVYTQTTTNCLNPATNGTVTLPTNVQVTQSGQSVAIVTANLNGGDCAITGTYSQLGRSGRIDGSYACNLGEAGTTTWIEMNNHVHQFDARYTFQSTNNGCLTVGQMTGVIPDNACCDAP